MPWFRLIFFNLIILNDFWTPLFWVTINFTYWVVFTKPYSNMILEFYILIILFLNPRQQFWPPIKIITLLFYFTIQGMVKYCNRALKKWVFLLLFFEISQQRLKLFLLKKIGRNHGISLYKKALISQHRKNYIFRDNNCFVKMSVSLYVTNSCGSTSSITSVNINTKFHT